MPGIGPEQSSPVRYLSPTDTSIRLAQSISISHLGVPIYEIERLSTGMCYQFQLKI